MCTDALLVKRERACVNAALVHATVHTEWMGATQPKTARDVEYRQQVIALLHKVQKEYGLKTKKALGSALGVDRTVAGRYLIAEVRAPLYRIMHLERTLGLTVPKGLVDAFYASESNETHSDQDAAGQVAAPADLPAASAKPAVVRSPPAQRRVIPKLTLPARELTTRMPVISWVAAGALSNPTTQIEPEGEEIEITDLGAGEYFATRVRGDSMDRLAPEGALLVVNRRDIDLARGRRYIFSLKGETTFKRYGEDPPHLAPESMNPTHQPKILKPTDGWSVIGRVRKVIIDV